MSKYVGIIWGLPTLPFAFPGAGFENVPFASLIETLESVGVECAYETRPRWVGSMIATSSGRNGHPEIKLTAFTWAGVGNRFANEIAAAQSAWERARPLIEAYCGTDPGPGELVLVADSE